MQNFEAKTVIVTGAAGNLGVAVTRAFLKAGASLALVDRSPEMLGSLIPELVNTPWYAIVGAVDLLDEQSVVRAVEGIQARLGHIDILVNTVGGYRGGKPFHVTPEEDWEFMLNINLRTVRNACRAVIPYMLNQGAGRIINVAARSALVPGKNSSAYNAAKGGVLRLTESLSAEYKEAGLNINCVLPGTIDTPQNRAAMPNADFSRWTQPEAIADVVLFLASDVSRAVHGAAIPV
jgi:NAD(P)-dependent dehydrogenase (short-subunit alcohol dehydrogenase family)